MKRSKAHDDSRQPPRPPPRATDTFLLLPLHHDYYHCNNNLIIRHYNHLPDGDGVFQARRRRVAGFDSTANDPARRSTRMDEIVASGSAEWRRRRLPVVVSSRRRPRHCSMATSTASSLSLLVLAMCLLFGNAAATGDDDSIAGGGGGGSGGGSAFAASAGGTEGTAASSGAALPWNPRKGCHKVGHRRTINIPGCDRIDVLLNGCRGQCLSWAVPSPETVVVASPRFRHKVTSYSHCCRMTEHEEVTYLIKCEEGIRELRFPSALKCDCFDCTHHALK